MIKRFLILSISIFLFCGAFPALAGVQEVADTLSEGIITDGGQQTDQAAERKDDAGATAATPPAGDSGGRTVSDSDFLRSIYRELLKREPDSEGFAVWMGRLSSGQMSQAQVRQAFMELPEYKCAHGIPLTSGAASSNSTSSSSDATSTSSTTSSTSTSSTSSSSDTSSTSTSGTTSSTDTATSSNNTTGATNTTGASNTTGTANTTNTTSTTNTADTTSTATTADTSNTTGATNAAGDHYGYDKAYYAPVWDMVMKYVQANQAYVFGAAHSNQSGIATKTDCSGFVGSVYHKLAEASGIPAKKDYGNANSYTGSGTRKITSQYPPPDPRDLIKPGDVMVTSGGGHIVMFMGYDRSGNPLIAHSTPGTIKSSAIAGNQGRSGVRIEVMPSYMRTNVSDRYPGQTPFKDIYRINGMTEMLDKLAKK